MNKIKSFKDANELVKKMMENPELGIQLWNEFDSSRIMFVEADAEYPLWCYITLLDTVNDTRTRYNAYVSEAEEAIYRNRKDVNRLNYLACL